jgi:NADH-quinone oxidoreductase subunit L
MLFLVVSDNLLGIYIGWELVGVCSYLLIGFWFEKDSASSAGRKAFITTKLGDLGFFLAVLMIFSLLGTLNFSQVEGRIADGLISAKVAGMIALLLFSGAVGKSAQVPLHVWLPDAMEGPTPVSALIHAATMVAAGVYMVARTYFIFQHGAFSLEVVAWIGAATALLAATMALVATDIKRILAFSTVSQLGYMMLALGVGGRTAGIFHLTTHAFFKALLFLCAGSVIHAVHTNDIREMGGLSRKMIWTFWTFSFAWITISGLWPFAGFYSKDAIFEAALHSGHQTLFYLAVFAAFLTSFYMTRLYLLVFVTEPRNIQIFSHARESSVSMVIPLVILAILSLGSGLFFKYGWDIDVLLSQGQPEITHASGTLPSLPQAADSRGQTHAGELPIWFVPGISLAASFSGIILSFLFYLKRFFSAEALAGAFKPVYRTLVNKYGFDEFYIAFFVRPADACSRLLAKVDVHVLDQIGVDGIGWVTVQISRVQDWFDRFVVDGLVDFWGWLAHSFSTVLRRFQTGLVQNYIFAAVLGFGLLAFWNLKISLQDLIFFF